MRVSIVFSLFVIAALSQQITNVCQFDGFYQCTDPIPYNFEEPGPNAERIQADASFRITLPFATGPFGHASLTEFPGIDFDYDMAVRSYSPSGQSVWAFAAMYPGSVDDVSARYLEIKGEVGDRRAILTWVDSIKPSESGRATVQLKIFENQNFEVHVKEFVKVSDDILLNGVQYSGADGDFYDFYYYDTRTGNFSGTATALYHVPPPSGSVCGNNIVEPGESCDGGVCCDSTCNFKGTSTVCRFADGSCDIAETCTGSDSLCPADAFKSASTPCPEDFGVCDVKVSRTCSGNSGNCTGFAIPEISGSPIHWLAYNVISFGGFSGDTGAVGGRLAVKGDVHVTGGFSVGDQVTISVQNFANFAIYPATFSFVAGGEVYWEEGQIYPSEDSSIRPEFGYAGGSFSGSNSLQSRFTTINGGNLDSSFDDARSHYIAISNNLASETSNTVVTSKWSGLFISCNDNSGRYVIDIDASQFASSTWYSVDAATCPFGSAWVINVRGTAPMVFQGGDFPGIGERIVFNIIGSGRSINVNAGGVNANILGPQSTLKQNGGVTRGLVIVDDITEWRSGVNPSCADLQPFTIVLNVIQASLTGSTVIPVGTFNLATAGDKVSINGNQYSIASRNSDENGLSIVLSEALKSDVSEGSFLKITIDPNQPRGTDSVIVESSSASSLVALSVLLILALLF